MSTMTPREYTGGWEYDVFVCFAGDDTRGLFTSHIEGNLQERKVKVFTDEIFGRTININKILPLIDTTPMSVVLFSKNFAKSTFCLNEVVRISQHMDRHGHRVLPVFYRVDPKDVTDDFGSYASIIHAHENSQEEKERWMNALKDLKALKDVGEHAGRTTIAIKDEYQLCMTIVKDVLKTLEDMSPSGKLKYLVGMDARVSKVEQFLAMEEDSTANATRVIGLWGMGGVGKTTLADAWYHKLTSPTNSVKHHFVLDISGKCKEQHRVEELVLELYSNLLSETENNLCIKDLDVVFRRDRLSRSKVVVVLDNVETRQQLDRLLLGEILDLNKLVGSGSIIIITSRDQGVLKQATDEVYSVEGLNSPESLELFMLHAFRRPILCATDDFMKLARRIVSYCKGNPLALKVLGGALYGKDETYWTSFLSRLEDKSNPEIHHVLRTSYDSLEPELQTIFMDVASFLFNTRRSRLIKYLATSNKSAYSLIQDLIDKSLLVSVRSSNDRDDLIVVHDLLKEMAWKIVKSEQNPSRLRNPNDLCKLFEVGEGKQYCWKCFKGKPEHTKDAFDGGKGIESLVLDLSKAKKMDLRAKAFDGMNSLRFIGFHNQGEVPEEPKIRLLDGKLDILPKELMWFEWFGFPSKYLPQKFLLQNLVALILRHSRIQRFWERGQPKLVHLVTLDLSYSTNLHTVPDLSQCEKLEVLRLKGCIRLTELLSHVENLEALVEVDLSECENLMHLPARLKAKRLKYFRLAKCPKLTRCPEIDSSEEGDVLEVLDLEGTPVKELPSAIHNVKSGGILRLCGKHITTFPRVTKSLQLFRLCHTTMKEMNDSLPLSRFDKLELVGNSQLVSLSNGIWNMVKYKLYVVGSPLLESLPAIENSINDLTGVFIENCGNLESFPSGIEKLVKSVQTIRWLGTAIQSVPSSIYQLKELSVLNLSFSQNLEYFPDGLNQLAKLSLLALRGCANLKSLPRLLPQMLQVLSVSGCKSLEALPHNIVELKWSFLRFENCPQLDNKLGDQIVEKFRTRAVMSPKAKGSVLYSGSELPSWCSIDIMNCEMELPAINPVNRIVFGVVFSSDATAVELNVECNIVEGNGTTVATFLSPVIRICGGSVASSSDYVLLWFDKKLLGEPKKAMEENEDEDRDEEEDKEAPWYVKYAGKSVLIQIRAVPEGEENINKVKNIKFKRLGVSLL